VAAATRLGAAVSPGGGSSNGEHMRGGREEQRRWSPPARPGVPRLGALLRSLLRPRLLEPSSRSMIALGIKGGKKGRAEMRMGWVGHVSAHDGVCAALVGCAGFGPGSDHSDGRCDS
jgi:hypothetical protein